MKSKIKRAALLTALLLVLSLLSGCAAENFELSFLDDGSVQYARSRYIAESYISSLGSTPREYYKAETAAGGTLDWFEADGETYWGIAPVINKYDSYDDLQKAMDREEGVSMVIRTDGGRQYAQFTYEIPSLSEGIEQYAENASEADFAGKAVAVVKLRFPGGVRATEDLDETRTAVSASGSGQLITTRLCAKESSYKAVISGWLEGSSGGVVENLSMTISEPIGGISTPATVSYSVSDNGAGGIDRSTEKTYWFRKNAEGTWDLIEDQNTLFRTGEYYSVDYYVYVKGGYTISDGASATVNGLPSDTTYSKVKYSDNRIRITANFGPLEGEAREQRMIEQVWFTIDPPREGATPADLKCSVQTAPAGALDPSSQAVVWYRCSSKSRSVNKWVEVKPGEAFVKGMFYSPDVFLYAADGYAFSPLTEGWINGEAPDTYFGSFYKSDKKVYLARMFDAVGGIPFTDVADSANYRDAVYWAYNACPQVTDGTSATTFSPDRICNRGQVVTFLWRAAGEPEPRTTENPFYDVSVSDYFYKPVLWAIENKITDGTGDHTFSPYVTCRNSHILTFIWRAVGRPVDTGAEKTNEWYRDALTWAMGSGMLDDTYTGTFDVNGDCPRANVVEYLYRHSKMR